MSLRLFLPTDSFAILELQNPFLNYIKFIEALKL